MEPAADAIHRAFEAYRDAFQAVTRRARSRFEARDWRGMQADARERLDLYGREVTRVVAGVREILGGRAADPAVWTKLKGPYSRLIESLPDAELAETFFNSVTRRIFSTVGVNPAIEYVDSDFDALSPQRRDPVYRRHVPRGSLATLVSEILEDHRFAVAYQQLQADARLVADEIEAGWQAQDARQPIEAVEVLRPIFFRNKGAYLIGRVLGGHAVMPLALALLNTEDGVAVDAALTTEDELSILFSFTHSYFHVELERPRDVVEFVKALTPLKRVAEIYIALGHIKHGKTELYRDILRHLGCTTERFDIAPGDPGMVMTVFTLPSYDVVFKVIRDRIPLPKTTTRPDVLRQYQLVFTHDRAGRLVDAQEFEHLAFARERFSDALLAELQATAAGSVSIRDGHVVIRHLYTQRRMTPLNLHLREAGETETRHAAVEYGQAIKDLAATNIFPGDLLLKNFGVTRHGRVAFYDYDELCLLTDCNFRQLPEPRDLEEELAAEPWFYVGDGDIFPEEFFTFMGLMGPAREAFLEAHEDLLRADFWRTMQARIRAGEIMDIFPYQRRRRLRLRPPAGEKEHPA